MFIEPAVDHAPAASVTDSRRSTVRPTWIAARPGPDLAAHGWTETEYVVRGMASSYVGDLPAGRALGARRLG